MKNLVIALVALCAATVIAGDVAAPSAQPGKMMMGPDGQMHPVGKIDRAKLAAAIYRRTGERSRSPARRRAGSST